MVVPERIALVSGARRVRITGSLILGRELLRLVPDYQTVSRRHARIYKIDGDGWYISHMSEKNPTFLDGTQLPGLARRRLSDGSEIKLGSLVLTVEFE